MTSPRMLSTQSIHSAIPGGLSLVSQHTSASVFHTRGWLRALQKTYGYEPIAFTLSAPSEALKSALVFCIVRSWLTGNRLVSLPFSDHCEPLVEHPEQFRTLSDFVVSARTKERWKYVELRSADPLLDCGCSFSSVTTYRLHRLDLRPSLDLLYKGFHKDCIQRKIARAEREGLSYEAGRSDSLLHQLYGLLQLTRSRHHLPPQPIEWFRNLVAGMGEDACIRIASKAGQPVAGILTLRHRKSVVYKYGGSDTRFNNLGGTAMLLWQAIKDAKQAGTEVLDLGRSDLDNPGLIAFKESLVRRMLHPEHVACASCSVFSASRTLEDSVHEGGVCPNASKRTHIGRATPLSAYRISGIGEGRVRKCALQLHRRDFLNVSVARLFA